MFIAVQLQLCPFSSNPSTAPHLFVHVLICFKNSKNLNKKTHILNVFHSIYTFEYVNSKNQTRRHRQENGSHQAEGSHIHSDEREPDSGW